MDADRLGNFYTASGRSGSLLCGSGNSSGALLAFDSAVATVRCVPLGPSPTLFGPVDVGVRADGRRAYMTVPKTSVGTNPEVAFNRVIRFNVLPAASIQAARSAAGAAPAPLRLIRAMAGAADAAAGE